MAATCAEWQELFLDALDGTASEAGQAELALHIENCRECATAARQAALVHRMLLEAGVERRIAAPAGRARPRPRLRLFAAAAALLALCAGAWLAFGPGRNRPAGTVVTTTDGGIAAGLEIAYGRPQVIRRGGSAGLRLADGSFLKLAELTEATVTARRRVLLARGEVELECRADRRNPFVISAAGVEARAVGTRFSVRIDDEEEEAVRGSTVRVAVISGVVIVTNALGSLEAGEGKRVICRPGVAPVAVTEQKPAATDAKDGPAARESLAGLAPRKGDPLFAARVSFEAVQEKLTDVLAKVSQKSGVTITWEARVEAATRNRPITIKMTKASVRLALDWLLALAGRTSYVIRTDECGNRSFHVTDRVGPEDIVTGRWDLLGGWEEKPYLLTHHEHPEKFLRDLVSRIRKEVLPESWKPGRGEMYVIPRQADNPRGPGAIYALVILQTAEGHERVRKLTAPLLARLRANHLRADQEKTRAALGPNMARRISVSFDRKPLVDCIGDLQKRADIHFVLDPAVFAPAFREKPAPDSGSKFGKPLPHPLRDKPTTLTFADEEIGKILSAVLARADAGLTWDYRNGVVFITSRARMEAMDRRRLHPEEKTSPNSARPAAEPVERKEETF